MKDKLYMNKLVVKKSTIKGYGVFARETIRKGQLIEECYILFSRGGDKGLEDYYFDAKGKLKYAFFTGFGSIYNHSVDPNGDYTIHVKKCLATIKAARTIKKGEEIFISYGDDWFGSRGWKSLETKKANEQPKVKPKKKPNRARSK